MEPLSLFVCVNEICGFGGREPRSELQRDCGVTEVAFYWETRSLASVLCAEKIK